MILKCGAYTSAYLVFSSTMRFIAIELNFSYDDLCERL